MASASNKFDYKTIGIAAILSSGLGVGGGMLGTDGVEESQFLILQKQIHREVETLDQRSEKRYKRGFNFSKKMEERGIQLNNEVQNLRVKVARLEARAQLCECK